MDEQLKNKEIVIQDDEMTNVNANTGFYLKDVKSAVEWLRKALAEGNPNIPTDDLIDKAFEDLYTSGTEEEK